jgi:hypothetical protein
MRTGKSVRPIVSLLNKESRGSQERSDSHPNDMPRRSPDDSAVIANPSDVTGLQFGQVAPLRTEEVIHGHNHRASRATRSRSACGHAVRIHGLGPSHTDTLLLLHILVDGLDMRRSPRSIMTK